MPTEAIVIIVILASLLVLLNILGPLIEGVFVGRYIFRKQLVRRSRDEWARGTPSDTTNYEQIMMWNDGLSWARSHEDARIEVDIVSEGYHLYGEYFDFKKDKAVIIIPGRTETLQYSYHYAKAYERVGFNVLVIDKRGHGNSDGQYEDNGELSYVDIHAWARKLEEDFGMKDVTLHGICIGASHCLFAATKPGRPENIKRVVTDGMYETFGLTFKNHMKQDKRKVFPAFYFAMLWARIKVKAHFITNGPIKQVDKLDLPILLIYSKLDVFSTPDQAKRLYEKCGSEKKTLAWFDKGGHSHVYYNNESQYERTLSEFFANN